MPERATLEVVTGASFLDLPVRRPRPEDENVRSLGPPEQARSLARTILRPAIKRSSVERDLGSREVRVTDFQDNGIYRIDDTGLEVEEVNIDRYSIRDNDPLSAAMTMERRYGYARGDWRTSVEATATLTSTADAFRLRAAWRHLGGHASGFEDLGLYIPAGYALGSLGAHKVHSSIKFFRSGWRLAFEGISCYLRRVAGEARSTRSVGRPLKRVSRGWLISRLAHPAIKLTASAKSLPPFPWARSIW